jgi:hypothetical protein
MLELGTGGDILRAFAWSYLALVGVLLGLALWLPRQIWGKAVAALVIVFIFVAPAYVRNHQQAQQIDEHKARYEEAKALFDEHCKAAGENIIRKVEGIEGIQLWGVREGDGTKNEGNPDWKAAGMPNASVDEGYISSFLDFENNLNPGSERGTLGSQLHNLLSRGFRFVDVKNANGSFVRYRINPRFLDPYAPYLSSELVSRSEARYAVDYEDISTPEGRARWIAGGKVKVVDATTSEILAEMTAFGFEPGFGSNAGGRQPWRFAKHCQASVGERYQSVRFFVDRVVKPLQGS